jgi:ComF family protein
MNFTVLTHNFLDLLFPIDCAGCGREDFWLCPDCLLKLKLNNKASCFFCGKPDPIGASCPNCASSHYLDGVFVCADYSDRIINQLIKKLKYSFASELGDVLGEIAWQYLKKLSSETRLKKINLKTYALSPIPLHKKRYNWRGFNQSEMIAQYLAEQTGAKCQETLKRVKHKTPQAKLGAKQRKENIVGSFSTADKIVLGEKILLIDDVATTGSTLEEAARILKSAGAAKVWGLVVAKG